MELKRLMSRKNRWIELPWCFIRRLGPENWRRRVDIVAVIKSRVDWVGEGRAMATMAGGGGGGGVPDLQSLVASLDAALLPCLPARELQAADRSTHPSHQVDVERHAADFMEAAKALQLYFIRAQHQHQPSREEALRKEIAALEAELKVKDALMEKQSKLLQHWQGLLEAHKNTHIEELERV